MKLQSNIRKLTLTSATLLFLLISNLLHAQNLSDVIAAEKSFAKYAADNNTRDAFVKYFSDSAIVFGAGNPAYGRPRWKARKPDSTLLSWYPSFAAISSSGDMGCTSGPWEFRNKKTDADAAGFGHFATIWEKQPNGEWLVKLDIGIQHDKQVKNEPEVSVHGEAISKSKKTDTDFLSVESEFAKQEQADGIRAFKDHLADGARIYRQGEFPEISLQNTKTPLVNGDIKYIYTIINSGISKSADFGYAYGKVSFAVNGKTSNCNYLRVWQWQKGKWKIILDLITA